MTDRLLVDTDVLIDFLRERAEAMDFFQQFQVRPMISVITVGELFSGVREGEERIKLDQFLLRCVIVELDEQISITGGLFVRQYRKSHGTELADALIAATSQAVGAKLVTLNRRHFPMLNDVLVPYVKA